MEIIMRRLRWAAGVAGVQARLRAEIRGSHFVADFPISNALAHAFLYQMYYQMPGTPQQGEG